MSNQQSLKNNIIVNKKVRSAVWFWLILILVIATFFRLWQIQTIPPGLYPDEAMNGNNALEALDTGDFKVFYSENNGREGLFINIQAIFLWLFGNKPWVLRLPSVIFGLFTVLGLFLLTRELFKISPQTQISNLTSQNHNLKLKTFLNLQLAKNEKTALLASFLLATSFWHINFSRIGFRAIMAPAFLVWGIYFLIKLLNQTKNKSQIPNPKSQINSKYKISNSKLFILSIISGAMYGLGFHSYIAYRITPLLIIAIFIFYWFQNKEWEFHKKLISSVFYFLFSAAIVILPLAYYFFINPQDFFGRTSQISIFSTENPLAELGKNTLKTIGMFWYKGDYNWRHNYSGTPQLWWPVGALFGLGILISFIKILNFKSEILNPKQIQNSNVQNSKRFGIWNFGHRDFIRNLKLEIRNLKLKIRNNSFLPEIILFSWLFIGLLPAIISSEALPHALRAIIVLPAVMIISAIGLEWIISKVQNWFEKQKEKYAEYAGQLSRIKKEFLLLLFVFFISIIIHNYNQYFIRWANHMDTRNAFNQNYVEIGDYLDSLPKELTKYALVNGSGVEVRGTPMPAQTVMFITKTFLPKWQKEKNIYYQTDGSSITVMENGCEKKCAIVLLENDPWLRKELKEKIPELKIDASSGIVVLKKD